MPLLLLPKGAVPSRRDYAERTATSNPDECENAEICHLGVEAPPGLQVTCPRPRTKRSMSVTFGDVDVVCFNSDESD
eukprot:CAMPEP_0170598164 /NCGR_PEP_ID=MMETSP0224-20130122/16098_1 /TAXON_ID=285029 /ORGANISM="Togula jolla, Strain CCCM 725" /LENGTH=76 /DNA_ID=CAMNT_0010922691 /DNA_START=66 /DNA_END=296 /DNA_ORIENTATION=-